MKDKKLIERIAYLLKHQRCGGRFFDNVRLFPNCHGTSLFCLGIAPLEVWSDDEDLLSVAAKNGPGYVGNKTMEKILKEMFVRSEEEPPNLLALWQGRDLVHTGIYLGRDRRKEVCFHQKNYGGCYELFELREALKVQGTSRYSFHIPIQKAI